MLIKVKNAIITLKYSLYLATGLYQLTIGLFINLLVNFLMGVSLIVLYPYINPNILMIFQILAWILIAFGCYTLIFPFIKDCIKQWKYPFYIIHLLLKLSMGLTFLLIPFGIFLGISLRSELKSSKVKKNYETEKRNKYACPYTMFTLIPGIFHILLGLLVSSFLVPIILEEIDFLFPYVNYTLINLLNIYGLISIISGSLLVICSIWTNSLIQLEKTYNFTRFFKFIQILIIIGSIGLIIIYPFGTYFGITLLLEFYRLKQ